MDAFAYPAFVLLLVLPLFQKLKPDAQQRTDEYGTNCDVRPERR